VKSGASARSITGRKKGKKLAYLLPLLLGVVKV